MKMQFDIEAEIKKWRIYGVLAALLLIIFLTGASDLFTFASAVVCTIVAYTLYRREKQAKE